jgi:hypothetical protein
MFLFRSPNGRPQKNQKNKNKTTQTKKRKEKRTEKKKRTKGKKERKKERKGNGKECSTVVLNERNKIIKQ